MLYTVDYWQDDIGSYRARVTPNKTKGMSLYEAFSTASLSVLIKSHHSDWNILVWNFTEKSGRIHSSTEHKGSAFDVFDGSYISSHTKKPEEPMRDDQLMLPIAESKLEDLLREFYLFEIRPAHILVSDNLLTPLGKAIIPGRKLVYMAFTEEVPVIRVGSVDDLVEIVPTDDTRGRFNWLKEQKQKLQKGL